VVKSLKTEAMYFSKHDQVGHKIQVASAKIQVGTTIRAVGVMSDSKLSWGSHIIHMSKIVRKISADLNPFKLFGIAHVL
jgi:hypothetical protein